MSEPDAYSPLNPGSSAAESNTSLPATANNNANANTNAVTSPDLTTILAALATMQLGLEATSSATQASLIELGDRLTAVELSGFQDAASSPVRASSSRPSLGEMQPGRRSTMFGEPGAGFPSTPAAARSTTTSSSQAQQSPPSDALSQVAELARQAEALRQQIEQQQSVTAFNAQGVLTTASKRDFKGKLSSLDFPAVVEFLRLFRLHVLEEGNIFSLILYITTEARREIVSQFNAHSGSTTKLTEASLLGDTASPAMTPHQRLLENERVNSIIALSFKPRTYVDVFLRVRQCFAVGEVHGIDLLSGESPDYHSIQLYCSALSSYITDILDAIQFAFGGYTDNERSARSHIMPRYRYSKQFDMSDPSRKYDLESLVTYCLLRPAKNGYDLVTRQLYLTSCTDHKTLLDEDKHAAQGGTLLTLTTMLTTISTKANRLQTTALARVQDDEGLGVMRTTLTRADLYEQLTGKKATDYFKVHLATKPRQLGSKRDSDDNDMPPSRRRIDEATTVPRKFVPFARKTSFSAFEGGEEVEKEADSSEVPEASPSLRHDVDEDDDYQSVESEHDDTPFVAYSSAQAQDEARPLDATAESFAALVGGNPSHPLRSKEPLTRQQMAERPCFLFQKEGGCNVRDCPWSHDLGVHTRALNAEVKDRQERLQRAQANATGRNTGHQQRAAQQQPPRQELRRSERGHDRR